MFFSLNVLFFVGICLGNVTNYILIPKQNFVIHSEVIRKFNLQNLASFESLTMLTTDHNNLIKNKKQLGELFDIEEDQIISIESTDFVLVNNVDNWHLDKLTQSQSQFPYKSPGSCHTNKSVLINSYVVDTGIDVSHPQFEGRATWSANFADDINTDCNNHGTHVAGLIGSKDYGACVDANLFAVKVLDCQGSGSLSGVIKGIEWVYNKHKADSKKQKVKSIINMSLGGGFSSAINRAVETCLKHDQNFYIVVAAGNENQDACKTSPASARSVLTVMASDINNNRAWFSNWGQCADLYSPGVDVMSTIPGKGLAKYSGTSMASPIAAGVLNHYIDAFPDSKMSVIKTKMQQGALIGAIHNNNKQNTKNLLVQITH